MPKNTFIFLMAKFYLFFHCSGVFIRDMMLSFSTIDVPLSNDHAFPDHYIVTPNLIMIVLICYLD